MTMLTIEGVPLNEIAKKVGTPCYIYSRALIENNWKAFEKSHYKICYAVKANSNLGILNLFANKNAGFDIVSQGELERVLAAGGNPKNIVFSGVGKTKEEIKCALQVGIYSFNVESWPELERIQEIAQLMNKKAPVTLRVNPNIDAKTHPYIATGLHHNKFGIELKEITHLKSYSHIDLIGLGCHIGSQIMDLEPFGEAIDCLLNLAKKINSIKILNLGGGLGIQYKDEKPPSIKEYLSFIEQKLKDQPYEIILEPGRSLVGNAGILLTKVEYIKETPYKNFAILDAGMNDLIRPALYDAWHNIIPVTLHTDIKPKLYDLVGPVCETGDFFAHDRELAIKPDDLLAISTVGAYGASMSSNYNSRPSIAEVLVDKDEFYILRERESYQDLFAKEKLNGLYVNG